MPDVREPEELELRYYLSVLWRRKLIMLGMVVLCVGGALAYTAPQEPTYRASADVLLQGTVSETILEPDGSAGQSSDRSRVETEMEVMGSRSIEAAVTEALGHRPRVSIKQLGGTDIVTVQATSTDPDVAAHDVQVYAETYVELRRLSRIDELLKATTQVQARIDEIRVQLDELQAPLLALDAEIVETESITDRDLLTEQRGALADRVAGQLGALQSRMLTYAENLDQLQVASNLTESGGAQVVSDATVPGKPFSPKPGRNVAAALALGLVLGLVGAFVRDHFDDSISSANDLEGATGNVSVLALVPMVKAWTKQKEAQLISLTAPHSPAAEAYRSLRASLDFLALQSDIGIVQMTSSVPGEGKSTSLSNLGVALARAGRRVVIVDCDLRRPRIHSFFGLDNAVGLSSVVHGEVTLAEAIQRVPSEPHLSILSSGGRPPNPAELLSHPRVAEIFNALKNEVDFVLVDSPPVLPVADAVIVAGLVDAIVLVAKAGSTSRRTATRAFEVLIQVHAPIVGTLLNQAETASRYGYRYGYTYGSPSMAPPVESDPPAGPPAPSGVPSLSVPPIPSSSPSPSSPR